MNNEVGCKLLNLVINRPFLFNVTKDLIEPITYPVPYFMESYQVVVYAYINNKCDTNLLFSIFSKVSIKLDFKKTIRF